MTIESDRPAGQLPAAELAELNELLWSLPATPDPYQAVAVLLEKGARLFRAPLSCVYLKEGGRYELAGVYGFTDKKADQLWGRLDLAQREAAPMHLTGSELHALSSFGKRRLGALLAMPLQAPGGHLGWLIVARFDPQPFTDFEQSFMGVILERVAAAIEVARRFQDSEHRSQELALLYEIAELLVTTVQLDPLLDRLNRRMVESFDLTFSAIRLLDTATDTMPIRRAYHRDPEELERLGAYFMTTPLRTGEGRTGWIFRNRKPYVARDVQEDPMFEPGGREVLGTGSMIAVPLFVRDRVIGVLFWFRAGRQRPLSEGMLPMVGRLGNLVSVAIVNAQLYQDLEQTVAERTADLKAAHQELEARMAFSKEVVTNAALQLRGRLQDTLGYGDLLHSLLAAGGKDVHLQADYLDKLIASAEDVSGLVEGLIEQLRTGDLG